MKIKALYFSFLSQFFEILSLFKKLNANSVVFNSINNTEYNFNSKYLFEYYVSKTKSKNKNEKIYFVINNKAEALRLRDEIGDYFISTYSIRGLYITALSKVWVCSGLNTPYFILPVFKNSNRIIYHIGHGIPLKKMGLSEEKITSIKWLNRYLRTRAFTHVLSYSSNVESVMKDVFKNKKIEFVHLGQPRNDNIYLNNKSSDITRYFKFIQKDAELILYAPTWRNYSKTVFFPYSDIDAYKLNNLLVKNNKYLFLRGHPYYESEIDESYLSQSNILLFSYEEFPEVMDYISCFDKLITDYSSIYLDYLLLDRPVAFLPYDIEEYIKFTGFSFDYNLVTPGPKLLNNEELINFIFSEDVYSLARRKLKDFFNLSLSSNCRDNYFFINKLKGGKYD